MSARQYHYGQRVEFLTSECEMTGTVCAALERVDGDHVTIVYRIDDGKGLIHMVEARNVIGILTDTQPHDTLDPTTARLAELNRTLELIGNLSVNAIEPSQPYQEDRTRDAVLLAIESLCTPFTTAPCDESDPST